MDDDLLARLNALKGASGGPGPAHTARHASAAPAPGVAAAAQSAADDDAALEALAHALPTAPDDDDDLEALLASIGGDSLEVDYLEPGGLERDASALLDEARRYTTASGEDAPSPRDAPAPGDAAEPKGKAKGRGHDSDDDGEGGTAASILERALAEAALSDDETAPSPAAPPVPGTRGAPVRAPGLPDPSSDSTAAALAALSSLSPLPELKDDDDVPPDMKARMELLSRLRGPSNFPAVPRREPKKEEKGMGPPPRAPGQGWGIPGYDDGRDDDLDSWCSECLGLGMLVPVADPGSREGSGDRGEGGEECRRPRRNARDQEVG